MRRRIAQYILLTAALAGVCAAQSYPRASGWCEQGGGTISVNGNPNTPPTKYQKSFPQCTITVYLPGTTTLATLFSNSTGTALANPFTASTTGFWGFYAADGVYDVQFSGTGISAPFTISRVTVVNPLNIVTLSVTSYGVKCDGTTDDTTAFQAAITAAISVHKALSWPGGGLGCVISSTLSVTNARGFILTGSGPSESYFIWKGSGTGLNSNALALKTCYRCAFRDFGIQTDGVHTLEFAVTTQQTSGATTFMSQPQFDDIRIEDGSNSCKLYVGFYGRVGSGGDFQNDFHQYNRVIINNVCSTAGAGWLMEGFENHGIHVNDSLVYGGAYSYSSGCPVTTPSGTYGLDYSGYFMWKGGFVSQAITANFCIGTTSGLTSSRIEGVGSEASNRFLVTGAVFGSSTPAPVDLQNIRFASNSLNADSKVIIFGAGGPFHISDSFLGSEAATPIRIALGGNPNTDGAVTSVERTEFRGAAATDISDLFTNDLPVYCLGCVAWDTVHPAVTFNVIPPNASTPILCPSPLSCTYLGDGAGVDVAANRNTAIGQNALPVGDVDNVAVGVDAGRYITGGVMPVTAPTASIFIGNTTKALAGSDSNEIVIGHFTTGHGSNTATIGDSITDTYLGGKVHVTSGAQTAFIFVGNGTPEGVVTAAPGSLYMNTAGGASTSLYVKTSGSGNTGWTGK